MDFAVSQSNLMTTSRVFTRKEKYDTGHSLLEKIDWQTKRDEMLKLPSIARGTELRRLMETKAQEVQKPISEIADCVHIAARIDHLVAIGGDTVQDLLLNEDSHLNANAIAKLCRRMPPFIAVKLRELHTGPINVGSNPSGAFDTNGWSELRTRLPKFRSTLQHYAANCTTGHGGLETGQYKSCRSILTKICSECDVLSEVLKKCTPAGQGKLRIAKSLSASAVKWSEAKTKFAQVLGVLQKTNRDLKSKHWRPEWIPTLADHQVITSDVEAMKYAAQVTLATLAASAINAP